MTGISRNILADVSTREATEAPLAIGEVPGCHFLRESYGFAC